MTTGEPYFRAVDDVLYVVWDRTDAAVLEHECPELTVYTAAPGSAIATPARAHPTICPAPVHPAGSALTTRGDSPVVPPRHTVGLVLSKRT